MLISPNKTSEKKLAHPNPAEAWSGGAQQVTLEGFGKLMEELKRLIHVAEREINLIVLRVELNREKISAAKSTVLTSAKFITNFLLKN